MRMVLSVQISFIEPVPCVWRFDGFSTPALNERLDEKPPRLQGVLLVRVPVVSGALIEEPVADQKRRQAAEIVAFYRDQGITALDLQRMVGEDARQRLTVGTIRARADADIPAGSRGTISRLSGALRSVDNSAVPVETPP